METMDEITSGFDDLDSIIGVLRQSDLVIIEGKHHVGKTSLALNVAKNIAYDNKQPVAFFSLEHNRIPLAYRLVSNIANVKAKTIFNGIPKEDRERFDKIISNIKDKHAPLWIDDSQSPSVIDLTKTSQQLISQFGVRIIIVDYLQLLTLTKNDLGNGYIQTPNIVKSLKQAALELNVPIVAVSQRSRGMDLHFDEPEKYDYTYADIVMTITRPKIHIGKTKLKETESVFVKVCKNNHNGNLGAVKLRYDKDYFRFESFRE